MSETNFSTQQEELFQKRFAEGYDIYTDDDYVCWLHINHPESLHSSDNPENSSDVSASISDHFSLVTVETPISHHFSKEQEDLFQKRIDEGYDIFVDEDYVSWLEIDHPEILQKSTYSSSLPHLM